MFPIVSGDVVVNSSQSDKGDRDRDRDRDRELYCSQLYL